MPRKKKSLVSDDHQQSNDQNRDQDSFPENNKQKQLQDEGHQKKEISKKSVQTNKNKKQVKQKKIQITTTQHTPNQNYDSSQQDRDQTSHTSNQDYDEQQQDSDQTSHISNQDQNEQQQDSDQTSHILNQDESQNQETTITDNKTQALQFQEILKKLQQKQEDQQNLQAPRAPQNLTLQDYIKTFSKNNQQLCEQLKPEIRKVYQFPLKDEKRNILPFSNEQILTKFEYIKIISERVAQLNSNMQPLVDFKYPNGDFKSLETIARQEISEKKLSIQLERQYRNQTKRYDIKDMIILTNHHNV